MGIIYVRSTDGSDADNGSTWALAKATLAGAAAIAVAGDTIYVSQVHAETAAASKTITLAGTLASPIKVICANDGAEPPIAVATTASVTTTGGNSITVGGWAYFYGIHFSAGSGNNNVSLSLLANAANVTQTYERCKFTHGSTASSAQRINVGSTSSGNTRLCRWLNCDVVFSGTGNGITCALGNLEWIGGTVSGTAPSSSEGMFKLQSGGVYSGSVHLAGINMSSLGAGAYLVQPGLVDGSFSMRNCKLPASWSGTLLTTAPSAPASVYAMHNCDNADTNYRLWVESYAGSAKSETTLVRTGGASDGTTPQSFKMVTSSGASYPNIVLASPEISIWNGVVGTPITITISILRDSATNLKDDEVWMELQALSTSGAPLGTLYSDAKETFLATSADQASSSETWTTTGMTNPNEQELSVTLTAQEVGWLKMRVMCAKASTTLYACPKPVVT